MTIDNGFLSPAVWLIVFPVIFIIHFAEEYWCGGGYPAYLFRLRGVHLSTERFLVGQLMGLIFFVAGGIISALLNFPEFMTAILGAFLLANGISHSVTAIWDRGYGPGLVCSVLLWMPAGILALVSMSARISLTRLLIALLIGFGINGLVAIATMRGARLRGPDRAASVETK
jgi:uncharacterized membrane protein HdeD (DUF308 family)